uniref:Plexin-B1 n=1 Tax=Cyprinus carpio TaxID=7962 RepID=A0A8C2I5L9_CYPCA
MCYSTFHALLPLPYSLFPYLCFLPITLLMPSPPTFITLNGSRLNHLLLDTHSGHVYVGAVNVLYHLSPDLQLLSWGKTGPKLDSPDCLPPIDPTDCTQAETTDNTNKLLLLEEVKEKPVSLIVCGTVLQGICEKRSLENVSQVLYKTDNPVDTQYVAANDPRVSTVGVVVEQKDVMLMLVGRGYTSKGPGGIPPITMRRLTPVARHSAPAFSHEELGKLVVGSYSEYNNHFVKAFPHNHYVYFVFSRRDVWGKREYRTYVSRLCAGDPNFYSYVEVPLSCGGGYNLAQAAVLGYHRDQPTLFVAMAMGQASTPTPTDRSALCVYKVEELDKALHGAQLLCYTQEGKDADNMEKAYIEYEVSSNCLKLPQDSLIKYPCGGEHTPSPIASAIALEATPTFTWNPLITAVTTATEVGHTIVLLGDKNGRLHKVFLHANGTGTKYDTVEVDAESPINADLLLDSTKQNVYVLTERKLHIAQCEKHLDCHSCLSNRDPYCGWCLLEGRCKRKMDCTRHAQPHHWIWSYSRERQCVSIESLQPSILSREEQTQVQTLIPDHLPLSDESLSCAFGSLAAQPAVVMENRITCQSPAPEQLPPSPPGNDLYMAPCIDRSLITYIFTFIVSYVICCRCMACVSSMWPCHWCVKDELCTHDKSCPRQHIIYNSRVSVGPLISPRALPSPDHSHFVCACEQEQSSPRGPDSCPCVWALQSFPLVPVGFDTELSLQGKNLDIFEVMLICRLSSHPIHLQLYDCSVGQSDCSQCRAVAANYGCVWCADETPGCVYNQSCTSGTTDTCPAPVVTEVEPLTGPLEGGILLTIQGSNLGQSFQDIQAGVTVAGVTCTPLPEAYRISTSIVCELQACANVIAGPVVVTVGGSEKGESQQTFSYQNPQLSRIVPEKGPLAGGTMLTVHGSQLLTGQRTEQRSDQITGLQAFLGSKPCLSDTWLICRTSHSNQTGRVPVKVVFGKAERILESVLFSYMEDPVITDATPMESFYGGGRLIYVTGQNLNVVQQPKMSVSYEPRERSEVRRRRHTNVSVRNPLVMVKLISQILFNQFYKSNRIVVSFCLQIQELCTNVTSERMICKSPLVEPKSRIVRVWFEMDNVHIDFPSIKNKTFTYHPNPDLFQLNSESRGTPIRFKPGGVLAVEGKGLTLAMRKEEVVARLGDKECDVKTLDNTHLYCEPPEEQPLALDDSDLPTLKVLMGSLAFDLGPVEYDNDSHSSVPLAAQIGLAAGAAVVVLIVLVIILMYRRKSKQALRDYKKVLVQLETLEINVGDQCRKEFTDLMTEMMDLSSDVGGPGIPFLDYRTYAERVFFPGQKGAPLSQNLDLPDSRRQTVEQGLGQLNNLLNNRLFLIRFIHTLEAQQSFSQRDRGYVASLLTMALHDKLEYFTDVMKTLLGDLMEQYVAKNPKLMLRRTETVVEKMLTNWMSICLYSFLKEVAGEPLYKLYRAIKYQVDKGPVDVVTGKAKRTLNDSHLLREDIDYCSVTLTVLVKSGVEVQPCPVKVLDSDTITQVKDKILDQIYKGAPYSQRPAADSLDLEWRSGQAGHLTLSDDDVTAIVQGRWKRINTLQHYKVPDGATVALIPRSQSSLGVNQFYQTGEKTPMLEGEEEEGLRLWHLVKPSEDPEIPKHRKSSMRERERAKAIPEIYLTRLLSMKGTLQKFVDDVFVAILSRKRPPPIAVRFFFDFLDDMAEKHGIDDPETVHIWKTNSLPLRFWVNILKNPQFVFDVQVTDSVDAVLSVIAQTFIDSCTTSEHKVGRDSPVNKLLYAREIPRYKQLVERYYSDIHNAVSGCYQEMNSTLTELSGMNSLVALHELYKYINKYYDQIIMSLEEDAAGQKMQLAYRLQQVAALVENKVTDL